MKVKKYTAPTMPEAMKKVRRDLGAEAVILNSKVIYLGGFLGLFRKKNIQVIAALDNNTSSSGSSGQKTGPLSPAPGVKEEMSPVNLNQDVLAELKEMREWMEKNNNAPLPGYPLPLKTFYYHLLETGINKEFITVLLDELNRELTEKEAPLKRQEIGDAFSNVLKKKLAGCSFAGIDYKKKFIHLVGPTGVGKTTSIAKLAANCVLKDKKKVALITTDTYRIAAIDQLRTYANILNIPLEVAYSKEDYQKAREKFRYYDVVLIDTAGRNFRNPDYVKELGSLVDLENEVDTYLVLSLTSKYADQKVIFKQFSSVPIKQFIFTKEDETDTYGDLVNMMFLTGKGIAYITNGQEVPDHIRNLSIEKINKMIVGEYVNA